MSLVGHLFIPNNICEHSEKDNFLVTADIKTSSLAYKSGLTSTVIAEHI